MDGENEISDLMIRHDRKWLCEALLNLLDNAVKYSPCGTAITIRATRMTSFLRIEIQDQGIGIPRENYHKVFQRFFRGREPEVKKYGRIRRRALSVQKDHRGTSRHPFAGYAENEERKRSVFCSAAPVLEGKSLTVL